MTTNPMRVEFPKQEVASLSSGGSHIHRAFQALEALVSGPQTAASIAQVLGVNRSTALRLMSEIESLGYVVRDPDTKSYAIAPARFYPFVASHGDHLDWSMVVDPILSDLRDEFGEAAIMGVPANGTMVYLAFFSSIHVIMVRERLGTTRPMHCSALGKAYLSALDDRALDSELAAAELPGRHATVRRADRSSCASAWTTRASAVTRSIATRRSRAAPAWRFRPASAERWSAPSACPGRPVASATSASQRWASGCCRSSLRLAGAQR